MPVCFCNENGTMAGLDPHEYLTVTPKGDPMPIPLTPHFVGIGFNHPTRMKAHPDVSMEKRASFEQGADFYAIAHSPLTVAPPHPSEGGKLLEIVAGSGSKMWMGVHGVTIKGGWAATCTFHSLGSNMNCGDPFDVPCGVVFNLNAVITEPTPGDRVGSAVAAALDAATGWGMGKGAGWAGDKYEGKTKPFVEQILKHTGRRTDVLSIIDLPGKSIDYVKQQVQESIDGPLGSST